MIGAKASYSFPKKHTVEHNADSLERISTVLITYSNQTKDSWIVQIWRFTLSLGFIIRRTD